MGLFVRLLNACVSFVAFITATALVLFMLIEFLTGTYDVVLQMLDTIFLEPAERQAIFNEVNSQFLHTVAILIILMKAYRILVEYMKNHHVDIKYIVEITIIACVLELLFNYGHYSEDMRLVLAGLGTAFLAVYAFRYQALKTAMLDTFLEPRRESAEELEQLELMESPKKTTPKRAPARKRATATKAKTPRTKTKAASK